VAKDINLSGTTAVSVGNDIAYIQWVEVISVGTTTVCEGNVTISTAASGAPTVAQTVELIPTNGVRSMTARYKIPTGYTGYLIGWNASAIGGADQDTRIRAQVMQGDRTLSTVFQFEDVHYVPGGSSSPEMDLYYLSVPSSAQIKFSSIPSAAASGNRLDVSCFLLLIEN